MTNARSSSARSSRKPAARVPARADHSVAPSGKTSEKIRTLHPGGKQGVNIDRGLYEEMRKRLLQVIPKRSDGVAFGDLARLVEPILDRKRFPRTASTSWYVVTVKQDLEARGLIEQVEGARPQRVRMAEKPAS